MSRLDKLADEHPDAVVIGWHPIVGGGPIIHHSDGYRYVNATGRVKVLPRSEVPLVTRRMFGNTNKALRAFGVKPLRGAD